MNPKTASDIKTYWKLLLAFRALPKTQNRKTFMEVSGYPHYENVCSNILAFYFDPQEEHGLKELLARAFLGLAKIHEMPATKKITIHPQHPTRKGGYIDLVIDSEAFTIGIENKIHHPLENDLEDYAETIDRMGDNKRVVKAVLGLHRISDKRLLKGDFISFTYRELWQEVRRLLGHYIAQANPKWVAYLVDLMQTTTNLAGENMELKETDQFFIDHNEDLEKMIAERDSFLKRLAGKLDSLAGLMNEADTLAMLTSGAERGAKLEKAPWVWKGQCVVLNFIFPEKFIIAFDLALSPEGWELQLFGRDEESARAHLRNIIQQPVLKSKMDGKSLVSERYILEKWTPIETDLMSIKEVLCCWVKTFIDAVQATQTPCAAVTA